MGWKNLVLKMYYLCVELTIILYCFTETVEQWYEDWHTLSLQVGDRSNEKMKLHDALKDCQLEKALKILSNECSSPQEQY